MLQLFILRPRTHRYNPIHLIDIFETGGGEDGGDLGNDVEFYAEALMYSVEFVLIRSYVS
jgi:hypothetical protein